MVKLSLLNLIILYLLIHPALAKNLGVHGHTFAIAEEDLLTYFEQKLAHFAETGIIEEHGKRLREKATAFLTNPQPVPSLKKTTDPRVFYFDPTIQAPADLKDHEGRIFVKAGMRFNPLKIKRLSKNLIFLAGDDETQIAWLKAYLKSKKPTTVILTSGNPIALEQELQHLCFFDQHGTLTKKLKITQVPAIVQQEGAQLRIEELNPTLPQETYTHAQAKQTH